MRHHSPPGVLTPVRQRYVGPGQRQSQKFPSGSGLAAFSARERRTSADPKPALLPLVWRSFRVGTRAHGSTGPLPATPESCSPATQHPSATNIPAPLVEAFVTTFGVYLRKGCDITDRRVVLHSLRHTVNRRPVPRTHWSRMSSVALGRGRRTGPTARLPASSGWRIGSSGFLFRRSSRSSRGAGTSRRTSRRTSQPLRSPTAEAVRGRIQFKVGHTEVPRGRRFYRNTRRRSCGT